MRRKSLISGAILALAGLLAGFVNFASVPGVEDLYEKIELPRGETVCGRGLVRFSVQPDGASFRAFQGPANKAGEDETWHKWNPCLKALLGQASKKIKDGKYNAPVFNVLRAQLLFVLSRPRVRFYKASAPDVKLPFSSVVTAKGELRTDRFDRVVYLNKLGVPYDAFSTADFGYWALQAHSAYSQRAEVDPALTPVLYHLGKSVLSNILDNVADGGLRTRARCAIGKDRWCSFFHSVTRDDRPQTNAGATLNKSTLAVRNLIWAALVVDRLAARGGDRRELLQFRRRLIQGGIEGAHHLVYGASAIESRTPGIPPNIFDFVAVNESGTPIKRSWLYYGFSVGSKQPYFLKENVYKNCGYHLQDMKLVVAIHRDLEELQTRNVSAKDFEPDLFAHLDLSGYHQRHAWLGGRSIIGHMLAAHDLKMQLGGLTAESPSAHPNGDFSACSNASTHEIGEDELLYLRGVNKRGR